MSVPESLERVLSAHPFFHDLSPPYLATLVSCARNERFLAGDFLFRSGEEARRFYLIRSGRVALEINAPPRAPLTIQTLGAGEIMGFSWLVPPYRLMFDARALETTMAIALDGKCLRSKCEADHDLGYEFLTRVARVMQERLQQTRLQLLDVYGDHS
jgi:CRP/FNR family cyclic AMP-dependent transcriptional regulator